MYKYLVIISRLRDDYECSDNIWHGVLDLSTEVVLDRNSDGSPEEVEDDDVLDVELGKEPVMPRWPVRHDGMSGEESGLGKLGLAGGGVQLDELSGEDDVGTARVLGVVVHLPAVAGLGEGHGEGGLAVVAQVLGRDLPGADVEVGNTSGVV